MPVAAGNGLRFDYESFGAQDAPSLQASKRIGKVFQEFDSDSSAMIVLEGEQPLGAAAHHYYDGLIDKLSNGASR